jgi:hypothetical protein
MTLIGVVIANGQEPTILDLGYQDVNAIEHLSEIPRVPMMINISKIRQDREQRRHKLLL